MSEPGSPPDDKSSMKVSIGGVLNTVDKTAVLRSYPTNFASREPPQRVGSVPPPLSDETGVPCWNQMSENWGERTEASRQPRSETTRVYDMLSNSLAKRIKLNVKKRLIETEGLEVEELRTETTRDGSDAVLPINRADVPDPRSDRSSTPRTLLKVLKKRESLPATEGEGLAMSVRQASRSVKKWAPLDDVSPPHLENREALADIDRSGVVRLSDSSGRISTDGVLLGDESGRLAEEETTMTEEEEGDSLGNLLLNETWISVSDSSNRATKARRHGAIPTRSTSPSGEQSVLLNVACLNLILELMSHESAWPFNRPVDPIREGALDYESVIQHPMDLRTIRDKLKRKSIANLSQFASLVNLVWSNAFTYNPESTPVRLLAEDMEREWQKKWTTLKSQIHRMESEPRQSEDYYDLRSGAYKPRETRSTKSFIPPSRPSVKRTRSVSHPIVDPRQVELENRVKQLQETLKKMEQTLSRIKRTGLNLLVHAHLSSASSSNPPPQKKPEQSLAKAMTWQEKRVIAKFLQTLPAQHIPSIISLVEKEAPNLIPELGNELSLDLDLSPPNLLRSIESFINSLDLSQQSQPPSSTPQPVLPPLHETPHPQQSDSDDSSDDSDSDDSSDDDSDSDSDDRCSNVLPPHIVPASPPLKDKPPLVLQNVDSWFTLSSSDDPPHSPLSFTLPDTPSHRPSFLDKSPPTDDAIWSQFRMRDLLNKQRQKERLELKQHMESQQREQQEQLRLEAEQLKLLSRATAEAEKLKHQQELMQLRKTQQQELNNASPGIDMLAQSMVMHSFEKEMESLHSYNSQQI